MAMSISSQPITIRRALSPISYPNRHSRSVSFDKWGLRREQDVSLVNSRTKSRAFQILANSNVSSGKGFTKEVIMVDPSEAKRLAAKQMGEIKAKAKFKRKREIEAINGAWAMVGLTASLVIEAQTGKTILNQLIGYWSAITGFFGQ